MKYIIGGFISGVVIATSIIGFSFLFRSDDQLMNVGECVETLAGIEKFDGTSKEKWDLFADYCAKNLK